MDDKNNLFQDRCLEGATDEFDSFEIPRRNGNWSLWKAGEIKVSADSGKSHAGGRSICVTAENCTRGGILKMISVSENSYYRLRFFYETSGLVTQKPSADNSFPGLEILPRAPGDSIPGDKLLRFDLEGGTHPWKEAEARFYVPWGADAVQLDLLMGDSKGSMRVSDFTLEKITRAEAEKKEGSKCRTENAHSKNLLVNGRFEICDSQNGRPAGWKSCEWNGWHEGALKENIWHDTAVAANGLDDAFRYGKNAVRIGGEHWLVTQMVSLEPGRYYDFSVKLKVDIPPGAEHKESAFILARFFDCDMTPVKPFAGAHPLVSATVYKEYNLVFEVPKGAFFTQLAVGKIGKPGWKGAVIAADAVLREFSPVKNELTVFKAKDSFITLSPQVVFPFRLLTDYDFQPGAAPKDTEIVMEFPDGITLKDIHNEPGITFSSEKTERDGKPYTRFIYKCVNGARFGRLTNIYPAAAQNSPSGSAYFYGRWEGKKSPEDKVEIRFADLKPMPVFDKFEIGVSVYSDDLIQFPGLADSFKYLGVNTIEIIVLPHFKEKNYEAVESEGWAAYKRKLNPAAQKIKDNGMRIVLLSCEMPPSRDNALKQLFPEEWAKSRARLKNGAAQSFEGPRPNYRGIFFEKWERMVRALAAYMPGAPISFDDEIFFEDDVCYAPESKEGFKAFLRSNYPQLEYRDPEFLKDSDQPLSRAWRDYNETMWTGVYADAKAYTEKQLGVTVPFECYVNTYPWQKPFTHPTQDFLKFSKVFSKLIPMNYGSSEPDIRGDRMKGMVLASKEIPLSKWICGVSPLRPSDWTGGSARRAYLARDNAVSFKHAEFYKYYIYELAVNGAKGIRMYDLGAHIFLDFISVGEALRGLCPYQALLENGVPGDSVKPSAVLADGEKYDRAAVRILTLNGNKEAFIYTAEYYSGKTLDVKFSPSNGRTAALVDTETGETVKPGGEGLFTVRLAPGRRGRMFYTKLE